MDPEPTKPTEAQRRGAWALWIGVVLLFLLVITAWTILIQIARDNPVETIQIEPVRSD